MNLFRSKRKNLFIISFCLILSLLPLSGSSSRSCGSNNKEVIISFPQGIDLKNLILHFPLDPLMSDEQKLYFLIDEQYLSSLREAGGNYIIETNKFHFGNNQTTGRNLQSEGGLNGAYHSYSELGSVLKSLAVAYPAISRLYLLGKSLENRNLYALKISKNPMIKENKPRIALLGGHHAREWISVEVPLLLAEHLLKNYSYDSRIKSLVDSAEIWIIPLVNPDGLDYSIFNYRLWRKNRRLNPDGSYGVDLNRNYSFAWGYDDQGSSPEPWSATYRGSEPFSEPETLAIKNLFQANNFAAAISYHSFSQSILYPWGYVNLPTEKEDLFQQLASVMADLIYQVNGRQYKVGRASASLYLTNGDFTDWIYGFFGIPAFTIELPPVDLLHGGFFNSEEDIKNIFQENLPAALFLMEWAVSNYLSQPATRPVKENRLEKKVRIMIKSKRSLF